MKKLIPLLALLIVPITSQAADIALYGDSRSRADIASFLEKNGHTIVYQNKHAPDSATLSKADIVISTRHTESEGNAAISDFVRQGGLLITEWNASNWALGTARLIDASVTGQTDFPTDSPINLTDTALQYGMGDNGIGPAYRDGLRTRVTSGVGHLGKGVEVFATLPNGDPAIIGGTTGNGYTLVNTLNWGDYFSIGKNTTGLWLLNIINNHEKYVSHNHTSPISTARYQH